MITKDFDDAAAWAKKNNRPIFIGEFGANSKADMDSRVHWTKFVADTAIDHGFSFAYWDFCANTSAFVTPIRSHSESRYWKP